MIILLIPLVGALLREGEGRVTVWGYYHTNHSRSRHLDGMWMKVIERVGKRAIHTYSKGEL